jgi:rhomboid protease GluP
MRQKQSLTTSLIVLISGTYILATYIYPALQSKLALFYGGQYSNGYFPGVSTGQWYRIFTVALVHAGWMHLIFNMLALYSIGESVERFVGATRFVIIFIFSLVTASLSSVYLGPHNQYAVGASGAIFGLFAALIVIGKKAGANYQNVIGIVIVNLIITFVVPGIDWHAHLGGLVGGFVITYALMFFKRT